MREDIMLWPDDTWCYRYEILDYGHKSDDYEVIYFGTERYENFMFLIYGELK